jgi:hypothetical protein
MVHMALAVGVGVVVVVVKDGQMNQLHLRHQDESAPPHDAGGWPHEPAPPEADRMSVGDGDGRMNQHHQMLGDGQVVWGDGRMNQHHQRHQMLGDGQVVQGLGNGRDVQGEWARRAREMGLHHPNHSPAPLECLEQHR